MSEKLTCPICGEPTRIYMGHARKDGLCGKHADMLKAGEIILDGNVYFQAEKISNTCCVCGQDSKGKPQCINCYNETKDFKKELNKNNTIADFREHYYNLKDSIYRTRDFEKIKSMCNRLFAIAELNKEINNDFALYSKVKKDISEIIERKKPKPEDKKEISKEELIKDLHKDEKTRTLDGHYVVSDAEATIDDLLFAHNIFHSYGKIIPEISEKPKKCDWFIPIIRLDKGIYIEYWGMKTPEYLKDRTEKEEYYKKNNIPYISIEKEEIFGDKQGLIDRIRRELKKMAKEYFRIEIDF